MTTEDWKCSAEKWCKHLDDRIESAWGEKKRGLSVVEVVCLKTNKSRVIGVCYRLSAKDRGMMLNFCPFCGEKILRETK